MQVRENLLQSARHRGTRGTRNIRKAGKMSLQKEGLPPTANPTSVTRSLVTNRDKHRCARCGKEMRIGMQGFSIHHRRLRSHPFKGLHEPSNLITLCGTGTTGCHGWVHSHVKEAKEQGYIVSGYSDPRQIPVLYYRLEIPVLHYWIAEYVLLDDKGNVTPY